LAIGASNTPPDLVKQQGVFNVAMHQVRVFSAANCLDMLKTAGFQTIEIHDVVCGTFVMSFGEQDVRIGRGLLQ
jgi:hypothetical protein